MLFPTECLPKRLATERSGHDVRRQEALLRALMAPEGVFHSCEGEPFLLDGMNQRFKRCRLRINVTRADEDSVATGLDGENGRFGYRVVVRQRFHFEIVAQNDAIVP